MKSPYVAICCLVLGLITQAVSAESLKVDTPRGAVLDVISDIPDGKGPFPAVVLGPGQAYPMALPALEQPARQLVERGVAVFRFNWAYYTKDSQAGRPSRDLVLEVEDMTAVLSKARSDPRIAGDKLFVGGKSLGSIVAWRVLQANKELKGALLLTPICSRATEGSSTPTPQGDAVYPGVAAETRPLAFILGEQDPLCPAPLLYRFAAGTGATSRVAVVGGDHGFQIPGLGGSAGAEATLRNARLAAVFAADFVAEAARR
jgi:dienelactone hydrolase